MNTQWSVQHIDHATALHIYTPFMDHIYTSAHQYIQQNTKQEYSSPCGVFGVLRKDLELVTCLVRMALQLQQLFALGAQERVNTIVTVMPMIK